MLADSYGMGFEYQSFSSKENDGQTFRKHGLYTDLIPGQYTDDTQMSVALAELVLSGKPISPVSCAEAFVREYRSNPINGYAQGLQFLMKTTNTGKELIEKIEKHGKTEKNGAAMRAAVFGLFPNLTKVLWLTEVQASVTHKGTGIVAAMAVAETVHHLWFRKLQTEEQVFSHLNSTYSGFGEWKWDGSIVKSEEQLGIITAKAGITAGMSSESFLDVLIRSVEYRGDTDTTAAIAAAVWAARQIQTAPRIENLPLWAGLYNDGPKGRDAVADLDSRFLTYMSRLG